VSHSKHLEMTPTVASSRSRTIESQGPDLNRRWAALQAAALGRTLPPWHTSSYCARALKPSGTRCPERQHIPHRGDRIRTASPLVGVDCGVSPLRERNEKSPEQRSCCSRLESMNGRRRTGFPRGSRTPVLTGTQAGLSSVFGMGTGVAPPLWPP
jgi:hypothetical protein